MTLSLSLLAIPLTRFSPVVGDQSRCLGWARAGAEILAGDVLYELRTSACVSRPGTVRKNVRSAYFGAVSTCLAGYPP